MDLSSSSLRSTDLPQPQEGERGTSASLHHHHHHIDHLDNLKKVKGEQASASLHHYLLNHPHQSQHKHNCHHPNPHHEHTLWFVSSPSTYHQHHHYYHHHHAHPHHQQTLCFLGRVRLPPGWQSWPPFKRASALSCSRYHHQDHHDSNDDDDDDEADYDGDADDENENTSTVEITKTVSVKAGPTSNRGGERGKSRHCRCSREDHHDTGLFSIIMLITMVTMMQACLAGSTQ